MTSNGGDVIEGIAIYNALTRFPGEVTVHVDGIAASIASLVALAGDKTILAENAMLMVHRPWTAVLGDAEEFRRQAETLDKAWSAMLATYSRRTGRRVATLAQRVTDEGGEWWMAKGVRVQVKGKPETEEVIPMDALKESINKASYAYTEKWVGDYPDLLRERQHHRDLWEWCARIEVSVPVEFRPS